MKQEHLAFIESIAQAEGKDTLVTLNNLLKTGKLEADLYWLIGMFQSRDLIQFLTLRINDSRDAGEIINILKVFPFINDPEILDYAHEFLQRENIDLKIAALRIFKTKVVATFIYQIEDLIKIDDLGFIKELIETIGITKPKDAEKYLYQIMERFQGDRELHAYFQRAFYELNMPFKPKQTKDEG